MKVDQLNQVRDMKACGRTNDEIGAVFGVSETSIRRWLRKASMNGNGTVQHVLGDHSSSPDERPVKMDTPSERWAEADIAQKAAINRTRTLVRLKYREAATREIALLVPKVNRVFAELMVLGSPAAIVELGNQLTDLAIIDECAGMSRAEIWTLLGEDSGGEGFQDWGGGEG